MDIACPYISIGYVEGLLAGCSTWRVLTDAEELLSASRDRSAAVGFVARNRHRVRHLRGLHAKVIIGADLALVGSANLTEKGLAGRDEMGVLFEDEEKVKELRTWFDELWNQAALLEQDELQKFVGHLPHDRPQTEGRLATSTRPVKSKLPNTNLAESTQEAMDRLVEKLRRAPSRQWAEHYLDLVRELVEATGLDNDDARLVMSMPDGAGLPVTICQRYVLAAFRHGPSRLSMMLPGAPSLVSGLRVVRTGDGYAPRKDETEATAPWWISFEVDDPSEVPESVKEHWRRLVRREVDHGKYSSYRKHHEPVVFEAAMDVGFRKRVLDQAFGRNG